MKICSRQEKCSYDVILKLKSWGMEEFAINEILDNLKKNGFVDNGRYAELFVREKIRVNKWGRIKIRYHLKGKQIDPENVENAFKHINEEEYKGMISDMLLSKFRHISTKEKDLYRIKMKLLHFAAQRGYEKQLSDEIIDNLELG